MCQITLIIFNYHVYPKYLDRQASANNADPGQTPQNVAFDQDQHCLPFIQQFLDTSEVSKIDLFKFSDKYGKELKCPNTVFREETTCHKKLMVPEILNLLSKGQPLCTVFIGHS